MTLALVDPEFRVDYAKKETPPTYKCHGCGAVGCKLWRESQTFLEHQTLLCAVCAAKREKADIINIGKNGKYKSNFGFTDQIGNMLPAVPTEDNSTFWGYTSVPQDGCDWWNDLPTLPSVFSGPYTNYQKASVCGCFYPDVTRIRDDAEKKKRILHCMNHGEVGVPLNGTSPSDDVREVPSEEWRAQERKRILAIKLE